MPRRITRLPPRSICLVLAMLTWATTPSHAVTLSTGVLSDQVDQSAPTSGDPLDPAHAAPVAPFQGLRPPSTDAAAVINPPADPMVANVDGHPIYLSQLGQAVQTLPDNLRKMPFEVIYPLLVDRMIDHEALVLMARREKLDDDPKVVRQIEDATGRVLEGALLSRTAVPEVTEAAIQARYKRDFANQQAVEEVHARHILVGTEAEAKWMIQELNKGADFDSLARRFSKDPDSAHGGDLGFIRRDQVWKGFADLAFSMKPGEIAQTPIYNEFGWHVVQLLEKRTVQPPTLTEVHEALRNLLLQEAVQRVVAQAREGLRVHKFNLNGAPNAATTGAEDLGAPAPGTPQPAATPASTANPNPQPAATAPTPPARPQKSGN